MCDYSLEHAKSRPAVVGERLTTKRFDRGTTGFVSPDDTDTAVCLLPGTELAFEAPVKVMLVAKNGSWVEAHEIEHKVARFTKLNLDQLCNHHDGLEFPDRLGVEPVLLTHLEAGQTATVLQMPVTEESKAAAHNVAVPEYAD